jgi:hypothetical protein
MDTKQMLADVEAEIAKLERVAAALRGIETVQATKPHSKAGVGHSMSEAARRKISLALKARWAKKKSGAQPKAAEQNSAKHIVSAASRKKMAAAQKARWAKVKAEQKKAA